MRRQHGSADLVLCVKSFVPDESTPVGATRSRAAVRDETELGVDQDDETVSAAAAAW